MNESQHIAPDQSLYESTLVKSPRKNRVRKKITLDEDEIANQHEKEDKKTGQRKVHEIAALRGIFYDFF